MSKTWLAALSCLAGFTAGVIVCSHVWIQYARVYAWGFRGEYFVEQSALANRASIQGKHLEAALHSLNMAELESGSSFVWLTRMQSQPYWEQFRDPWRGLEGARLLLEAEPQIEKAGSLASAVYHAEAAVSLERSVCPDLAASEWATAERMDSSWSRDERRQNARNTIPNRSSLQTAMDSAFLDSRTQRDLDNALRSLRSSLNSRTE